MSGGAPDSPVHHRTPTVDGPVRICFLSWRRWPLQRRGSLHTGHCPEHTRQSGAPCRPLARPRVARGLRGRPLAQSTVGSPDSLMPHRTVRWILAVRRWTIPESDDFTADGSPDSPVNYSRTPSSSPESGLFTGGWPSAPDTVRCTTGQSGAPRPSCIWLYTANSIPNQFLLFLTLRHNTLVFKSMY
jgi:hypothetical protein